MKELKCQNINKTYKIGNQPIQLHVIRIQILELSKQQWKLLITLNAYLSHYGIILNKENIDFAIIAILTVQNKYTKISRKYRYSIYSVKIFCQFQFSLTLHFSQLPVLSYTRLDQENIKLSFSLIQFNMVFSNQCESKLHFSTIQIILFD
ncbi:unnamed protein product [Paramecium octaurelia]|uniref:Uncharacterized protein n=1 Tax=Paramecium octaurelia TaxID=43137 RepID=A0A8S1UGR1_PAROT|nr:unnamed protein product [Paramecium octaurelia]